jgi:hypothetical protein
MGYFHKKNVFLDGLLYIIFSCGILTVFFLPLLLFQTTSSDFSCVRSVGGIECILVKSSLFSSVFRSGEIKIHNPIAVDINKHINNEASTFEESADIRSQNVSYTTNIYSGYDYQTVRAIAKEINEFLLSSNAPSFQKRF